MALSPRHQKFVNGIIKGLTGKAAAIDAGFSEKTAESQASRLLRNVKVKKAIDEGLDRLKIKAGITAEEIILELKRVALTDIGQLFDENGKLKAMKDVPEDMRRAIAGFDLEQRWEGQGDDAELVTTRKVKMWDKLGALIALGKHLKLFTDVVEVKSDLASKLEAARKRYLNANGVAGKSPERRGAS